MNERAKLHCLIRNDEAIVEHLADQLRGEDGVVDARPTATSHTDQRAALLGRVGERLRKLQLRRAQLASLSPATEPTALKSHTKADSSRALQEADMRRLGRSLVEIS